MFLLQTPHTTYYILIYVDDIIVACYDSGFINTLIQQLSDDFVIKDLGNLSYFLGVEVHQVLASLILSQHRYITNLLAKANMSTAKLISSPMSTARSLSKFDRAAFCWHPNLQPLIYYFYTLMHKG